MECWDQQKRDPELTGTSDVRHHSHVVRKDKELLRALIACTLCISCASTQTKHNHLIATKPLPDEPTCTLRYAAAHGVVPAACRRHLMSWKLGDVDPEQNRLQNMWTYNLPNKSPAPPADPSSAAVSQARTSGSLASAVRRAALMRAGSGAVAGAVRRPRPTPRVSRPVWGMRLSVTGQMAKSH